MTITDTRPVPRAKASPSPDCLSAMITAGWDDFEIGIPYHDYRPYLLTLFGNKDRWYATVEDTITGTYVTVAHSEGSTSDEALWNVTSKVPGFRPWAGKTAAIPVRLLALAAILWAEATAKDAGYDAESAENHARAIADRDALIARAEAA